MNPDKLTILVVDDEAKYVRALKAILNADGFETIGASDGEQAVKLTASEQPALVLLDVRMPKVSGFEACRLIREFSQTPIIMLTAMAQKSNIVKGLELGADDYLTKPFSTEELLARVHAVLRRANPVAVPSNDPIFRTGDLEINFARCEVSVQKNLVHLTPTEFRLLSELAMVAGKVLSSELLVEKVWGEGYQGEDQMIPRVVHRLRQKIEPDPIHPRYVVTRPGLGYMLELAEESADEG